MAVLASGNYKLVIVNVAMTGLSGPLFTTLKELAQSYNVGLATIFRLSKKAF